MSPPDASDAFAPDLEWAQVGRPMPGEGVSGDGYLVQPHPEGTLVALVDGAGHGEEAAAATRTVLALLAGNAGEPLEELMRRCHAALRDLRGAVATLVRVRAGSLTWLGVGNVETVLVRARATASPARESCYVSPGMLGMQLPTLRPSTQTLYPGDALVLVSDGIRSQFIEAVEAGPSPAELARRVLLRYARDTDDALVLALRYRGALIPPGGP